MAVRQMKLIDGSPTAAIYARKSRATEKGESIENQINRGISLCELRGWGYIVFVDYDYSGKDTDRPDFEEMMKRIHKGELQYLVCYKLDRVSRSVSDFSNLIEELSRLDVAFISIKESFDTSTPMGRAMMYITAVFAQLERETIAERVRDNMIDRAKLGKWNGGPVPFGFDAQQETIEYKGRHKKVSKLIVNDEESQIIGKFYDWYLESDGSIRACTFRANEEGYRTKNNALWSHNQMSRILQNPLYCIADQDAYDYFKNYTDVQIVDDPEDFDGTHGLMLYNRRKPHKKTTRKREQEEWILTIGEHQGIIPGRTFAKAQLKRSKNTSEAPRSGQSTRSPLAGLVRCGRCSASMSVFSSPKDSKDKSKGYFQYFNCLTKKQKSKTLCDNGSVRADLLEDLIVKHITGLLQDKSALQDILNATNSGIDDRRIPLIAKRNRMQNDIDSIDNEISNLVDALGKGILPELVIKRKYKELEDRRAKLQQEYRTVSNELDHGNIEVFDIEAMQQHLTSFSYAYEYLSMDEKKKLLQSIVKEIRIDRNKVTLTLYFLPGKEYSYNPDADHQAVCFRTDKHALPKCKIITLDLHIDNVDSLPEDTIGDRIKKIRLQKGLHIKDLASLCGMSEMSISYIERGIRQPYISNLNKISTILGTTNRYLLGADAWPEKTPGQIIKKYRMINGWTQRQLAEKASLDPSIIASYESGKHKRPRASSLQAIYQALGYHR